LAEIEVEVPPEAAGDRLDRFLSGLEEVGSRAAAERLISERRVRVNGSPEPKSHRLAAGDVLAVSVPESRPSTLEPEQLDLRIAFEDEHLLVVDKPAGIVVHPSAGHPSGTLVHGLLGHAVAGGEGAERPGVVHRLDRDTSGLLVVARSDEAHRRLQQLLRRRKLVREYLALVRGRPRSKRGRIEAPIGRDRHDPTRVSLDTDTPREAVTNFEIVETMRRHALLLVALETGRMHQIRVHLAAIDLPVSGDPAYGVEGDLGLERQFLHAARLAFPHPFAGEPVEAESPLPPDLQAALEEARLSS
jgi:23S rRNA pseudouridine1911/1915/1917 synthase